MTRRQKVVVMGGGIGGLSAAHEFCKHANKYEIHVFERNPELGGQARSKMTKYNMHSELCWHAFGTGYTYFLKILNEVRDARGAKLISHLKPLSRYIYALGAAHDNKCSIEFGKSFITSEDRIFSGFKRLYGYDMPLRDKLKIYLILFQAAAACDARMKSFDSVLWSSEVRNMSPDVRRWVLDSTAIYLGMDYSKISKHFIMNLVRESPVSNLVENEAYNFYSLDGPMNTVLFDNWRQHLESRGVSIHLNTKITEIIMETGASIKSVSVECLNSNIRTMVDGDLFINALDTGALAELYPNSIPLSIISREQRVAVVKLFRTKYNFRVLHNRTSQLQTQVLFYIPYKLQPVSAEPTIVVFPDSPWFLMARIEGDLWETTDCDYLSVGIGIWDVAGEHGLTALQSTRKQLATECWRQMTAAQHNLALSADMPEWNIWDSFTYCSEKKEMITPEPKFSNNVRSLKLRPNFADENIDNLYHATAYARTIKNTYNMESAAEAGVSVAQLIESTKLPVAEVSMFWRVVRWFDNLFFSIAGSCCSADDVVI
jgi:uncharacterized protein with NAD-binding domain and iron-sulfur cluster